MLPAKMLSIDEHIQENLIQQNVFMIFLTKHFESLKIFRSDNCLKFEPDGQNKPYSLVGKHESSDCVRLTLSIIKIFGFKDNIIREK